MVLFVRLLGESFLFALQALRSNILRTILSLLGVTIGIFAIIGVFTVVDSLEKSIKESLAFLGDKVIYIEKWPYDFKPGDPWWDYLKRPYVNYSEYRRLNANLQNASAVSIFAISGAVMKYKNNSLDDKTVLGVSYEHNLVSDMRLEEGRYFTEFEVENGRNVVLIGSNVAEGLFVNTSALGKEIKIKGRKFVVLGVLEKQGENLLDAPSNDDNVYIPFRAFTGIYQLGRKMGIQPRIAMKGYEEDVGLIQLESEARGMLRSIRGQKPKDKDSFAMNRPEMLANMVTAVFDVVGVGGWIIGSFSILVGGFGIANIMFVSVKERTSLIGIQKSLGAKNFFILFEFLFEALFLSLIGGIAGLILVYAITYLPTGALGLSLSFKNVVLGLGVSSVVGVLSGIVPAALAARLDPVIAIRS